MMVGLIVVVTTVQKPTSAIRVLADFVSRVGGRIIVVGDRKGPKSFDLLGGKFFSLACQLELPFRLARLLPVGHYSRKNIGYLLAIQQAAACIYETDDDNAPMNTWAPRRSKVPACQVRDQGWVNVYRFFSDQLIWPRGLPLDAINRNSRADNMTPVASEILAPIQQGLANGSPDVDAVWRLVLDREIVFRDGPSIYLPRGAWCPFNSQSTWWFPPAYPLLYLPSHCSFRMTDIWRGFVAQRCLWELGGGLVFHGPEVFQDRNPHDLMRDFADEVPGYLKNREIANQLEALTLQPGAGAVTNNLTACYEALIAQGHLPSDELELVRAWLEDLKSVNWNPEDMR